MNGTLYFSARNGTNGTELWKSDGTSAGTVVVKDIASSGGAVRIVPDGSERNAVLHRRVRCSCGRATAPPPARAGGRSSAWLSSGLTDVNGKLYFSAAGATTGYELWTSDGTEAGTTLVKDIFPGGYSGYYGGYGFYSSSPSNLTNFHGTLFFSAYGATTGNELWKSDGTTAGTVLVKDIASNAYLNNHYYVPISSGPSDLTVVNGALFFSAGDYTNGRELWKSDGTPEGTVLVKDINPGVASASPASLTDVSGTLFFLAYSATTGSELWRSDGTPAGTVLVKDINPGSASSEPMNLINVNGTLFFSAVDDSGAEAMEERRHGRRHCAGREPCLQLAYERERHAFLHCR